MPFTQALDSSEVLLLLLEATLKGSLVLAAAGLATSLLRRSPAAVRHTIWTTALVVVAALPAIVTLAPKFDVGILPAYKSREAIDRSPVFGEAAISAPDGQSTSAPAVDPREQTSLDQPRLSAEVVSPGPAASAVEASDESAASGMALLNEPQTVFNWWKALFLLWTGGVFVVVLRYAVGWIALRRIRRRSEPIADVRFRLAAIRVARSMGLNRRVRFVWGGSSGMPLTWGFFRPTLLLPQDAREWESEKTLAVLRHELAHIKRWDCLVQALVYFVCAVYWFNPLVWVSAANSRKEREIACDDYVIRGGTAGTAYADHLLEIARSLRSPKMSGVSTIAMARPSELEGRLMAILSQDRHRTENTRLGLFATMGLLTAVALPLAAVRPVPIEPDPLADVSDIRERPGTHVSPLSEVATVVGVNPVEAVEPAIAAKASDASESIGESGSYQALATVERRPDTRSVEATRAYIEQANRLVEKAAKTLESIERLEPTLTEWQAEFGSDMTELLTPLILDQLIANPDTIRLSQIRRLEAAGIDADYIEGLASVGLKKLTVDELVSLAHADVDAEYVLQLRNAGYGNLTPAELSQLGFANVEPEDIAVWAELGYDDLTTQDLIRLAHADVDPRFVVAMADLGYRDLGPNDLTRMSHADVDPEFVAEMRRAGYTDLTADDLIRMSRADVDPDFVRELGRGGLKNLSPDELIRMGHADINADYVAELQESGLSNLTVDDLIRLKHADVDADYLDEMKELGFDTSDVDELVRLKYMDIDSEYIKRIREAENGNQ
jgi:beta-lactamase regulating signal transducer with metallopeptidase domain